MFLAKITELNKPDILEICKICCFIILEITREKTNGNLKKDLMKKILKIYYHILKLIGKMKKIRKIKIKKKKYQNSLLMS